MLTMPEDYEGGMKKCADTGEFEFTRWGNEGLGEMAPLWMLKYLPNMPASHIAIYNDLRGPNNSLTMREAAGNLAIGEAFRTIQRGHADLMVAGATGTRILPMQAIHALQTEQMAAENGDPTKASRPFDKNRTGMVAGEGAGMIVLEELASAKARGATIYAEVVGLRQRERRRRKTCTANATSPSPAPCNPRSATQERRPPTSATSTPTASAPPTATPTKPARSAKSSARSPTNVPVIGPEELLRQPRRGERRRRTDRQRPRPARRPPAAHAQLRNARPSLPARGHRERQASPAGRSFLNLSVTPQGQAAVLYVAAAE